MDFGSDVALLGPDEISVWDASCLPRDRGVRDRLAAIFNTMGRKSQVVRSSHFPPARPAAHSTHVSRVRRRRAYRSL